MQHVVTLHQRSEAETLLKEFTFAQMTRHYWGEFGGSYRIWDCRPGRSSRQR